MDYKLINPFFIWKKRFSIVKRLKELPLDLKWRMIYPFLKVGYIGNYDFDRLESLRDIHKGKTGFLLGNGPSVRLEDLEKLNGFVTFACNRIHMAYKDTSFRPDYVFSSDEQMIKDFGQEIVKNNKLCFFAAKKRPFLNGDYLWVKLKNGRPFRFSKEITKNVMGGGGTLITAIQIGYHMGIRNFLLYGVDHSFKFERKNEKNYANAAGEGNHFIKGYRSGRAWQAPVMELVEEAFRTCDETVRHNGGFIYNITRGGKLEVLERRNFDEMIKS